MVHGHARFACIHSVHNHDYVQLGKNFFGGQSHPVLKNFVLSQITENPAQVWITSYSDGCIIHFW